MKKFKTSHYVIIVFSLLVISLFVSNWWNDYKISKLEENGIETLALVTDIDINDYNANELEGKRIENYIFTFQFSTKAGEKITSIRTVEKKDFKDFFDKPIRVNDSINILYSPDSPKNNMIKKLHDD